MVLNPKVFNRRLPVLFLGSAVEALAQDGILRVADFLNYRVDPVLMDNCGAILANKLSKRKVTKVLAGCSSQGLLPALATSRRNNKRCACYGTCSFL